MYVISLNGTKCLNKKFMLSNVEICMITLMFTNCAALVVMTQKKYSVIRGQKGIKRGIKADF